MHLAAAGSAVRTTSGKASARTKRSRQTRARLRDTRREEVEVRWGSAVGREVRSEVWPGVRAGSGAASTRNDVPVRWA
jgi:hypothetical protein